MFGSKLPASRAFPWWALGTFLIVAAFFPAALQPVAKFFGIAVVSNFVFAVLTFFLLTELLSLSSSVITNDRRLRTIVSANAADQFKSSQDGSEGGIRCLVALPTYNEEENIPHLLQQLATLKGTQSTSEIAFEFCFINDGSKDQTPARWREASDLSDENRKSGVGWSNLMFDSQYSETRLSDPLFL